MNFPDNIPKASRSTEDYPKCGKVGIRKHAVCQYGRAMVFKEEYLARKTQIGRRARVVRCCPTRTTRNCPMMLEMVQPSLFVGSSEEGLEFARAVRSSLGADAEVTLWKD